MKRYFAIIGIALLVAIQAYAGPPITQGINTGAMGAITASSVTASNLTATRVPIVGTAGLLGDDSDLTFATDTLTATKFSGALNGTVGATMPAAGSFTTATINALVYWGSATAESDEGSVTLPTVTANYSGHGFVRTSSGGAINDSAEFEVGSDGTVNLIRATANVVVGAACADTKICISTAATQNPVIVQVRNGAEQLEIEFWYH
ncbi:MAG: hypothetical protein ABIJ57_00380 [Pseudomonadota bacterium]|uniref:Uncharacterized protein n=1 Tax=viral metagenome TaxID=1070528 RepID=A0A6M3KX04_9ZZZZ